VSEETTTKHQPAIDVELGLRLAANKPNVAKELLDQFMEYLPDSHDKMKVAHAANDLDELLNQVHKLHGACCYCGVPRLKESVAILETALKKHDDEVIEGLISNVYHAIEEVAVAYSKL